MVVVLQRFEHTPGNGKFTRKALLGNLREQRPSHRRDDVIRIGEPSAAGLNGRREGAPQRVADFGQERGVPRRIINDLNFLHVLDKLNQITTPRWGVGVERFIRLPSYENAKS